MKKTFYLSTPVYYVNGAPHLGHAYTTVAADTLVRYRRLSGWEVFFLTGSDEHGNKILRSAKDQKITPLELVNKMVERFQNLWQTLSISYDDFIRTTEERHIQVVRNVFQKLLSQGDIYKGKYEGWYCVPCESFWLEGQLKEGRLCPECGRPAEIVQEESYFFRLSQYQEPLLDYFRRNPDFVLPPTRMNEVVKFVKSGLRDLSVTRLNLKWGIPSPIDEQHTIYVWVDALINYISALGYSLDETKLTKFWPANVHLVGKDILKFHAVIWPALLLALGLALPRRVFAHGWWKVNGGKMSKSQGRVVDPLQLAQDYGSDQLRYFLLREVPFGQDGTFSKSIFIKRINSDLANDLGNLLNRTLPLVTRYCQGKIPSPGEEKAEDKELKEAVGAIFPRMELSMKTLSFSIALTEIWKVVRLTNLYVDRNAPWQLTGQENKKRLSRVLYQVLETLRILGLLLFPFIPPSAQKIWQQLGLKEDLEKQLFEKAGKWGGLIPGTEIQSAKPLFPRIKE